MNVTFYNGFNPGCDLSGFKVTGGNLAEPFPIQFDPNFMNSELPILESGKNYTIEGKDIVCEGGKKFKIPSFQFPGKPPAVSPPVCLFLINLSFFSFISLFVPPSLRPTVYLSLCWQTGFFKTGNWGWRWRWCHWHLFLGRSQQSESRSDFSFGKSGTDFEIGYRIPIRQVITQFKYLPYYVIDKIGAVPKVPCTMYHHALYVIHLTLSNPQAMGSCLLYQVFL